MKKVQKSTFLSNSTPNECGMQFKATSISNFTWKRKQISVEFHTFSNDNSGCLVNAVENGKESAKMLAALF